VVEEQHVIYIFVCVHACVRVPWGVGVCMRVPACSVAYSACNSYAQYCDVICDQSGSTIFFRIIS
jgi:hypothetical protein